MTGRRSRWALVAVLALVAALLGGAAHTTEDPVLEWIEDTDGRSAYRLLAPLGP